MADNQTGKPMPVPVPVPMQPQQTMAPLVLEKPATEAQAVYDRAPVQPETGPGGAALPTGRGNGNFGITTETAQNFLQPDSPEKNKPVAEVKKEGKADPPKAETQPDIAFGKPVAAAPVKP